MFKKLHPLIQNRALTITVAAIGDGKVRVNVVPQALESDSKANEKIGYSHKDKIAKIPESAIAALTTPLSLVGTPEEIDAELPMALAQFAESHVQLQKTIEDAKEQIASAVKEIQDREKSKSKSSSASGGKREEKSETSAANNELLPLWVKPATEAPTPARGGSIDNPGEPVAATPVQQTLKTEPTEVTH
jgi:PRTRC genetic system protein E